MADVHTVAQELRRRKDCRYGLKGVKVRVKGIRGQVFTGDGRQWDRHGKLVLGLLPEGAPPDACYPESARKRVRETGVLVLSSAELCEMVPPEGYLRNVPAEDCVLLSEWPIVCGCWLPEGKAQ